MGFLDKAKQAANELAAKADGALANAGLAGTPLSGTNRNAGADQLLRELGMYTYEAAMGRPVPEGARERVIAAISEHERAGTLSAISAPTGPVSPPPPPGAVAAAAAAAAAAPSTVENAGVTPPPPPVPHTPPPPAPAPASAPGAPIAPPPPPSWASPQ